ncbi:hypothetical protein [Nocardiopsis sp. NPDC057823]|uniref:hypothetical protein n=1 Tax=Nocardiopsis sp. NPDC057823 TaxID=3346256 RepID=UPI00367032B7
MAPNRTAAPLTAGVIADGAVKTLLGAAFTLGAAPIGALLGVPTWLMAASGLALLAGGGIEIACARTRPMPALLKLMACYDGGWVLTALTGLLITHQGATLGGEVWIGYQTVAPLVLAALLAPNPRPGPTH